MAAAAGGLIARGRQFQFLVCLRSDIKLPKIVQLDVVVTHAAENVTLALEHNHRGAGTDARLIAGTIAELTPLKRVSVFLSDITVIYARAFDKSAKNNEALIVDLRHAVVVSGLWDITSLLEAAPVILVRIELVRLALVAINYAAEHYDLMTEDGGMVMADVGRNIAALINWLPLDRMLGVVDQFRDTVDG